MSNKNKEENEYNKNVDILNKYRRKNLFIAYFLLITTFLVGGHRFYLHGDYGKRLTKSEKDKDNDTENIIYAGIFVILLMAAPIGILYFSATIILGLISAFIPIFSLLFLILPVLFLFEAFYIYNKTEKERLKAYAAYQEIEKYRLNKKEEKQKEYESQFVMENL